MEKTYSSSNEWLTDFLLRKVPDRQNTELTRRILLLYSISSFGIIILTILSYIAFRQGAVFLCCLDLSVAVALAILLTLILVRGFHPSYIYTGVAITFILYVYLFITGGVNGTAFMWYYTFPLFAQFLLGSRHGLTASLLLFVPALAFLNYDIVSTTSNVYSVDFALRFIPSYLTVVIFAYLYERSRSESHQSWLHIQKDLEKLVDERTENLNSEIQKRKEHEVELKASEQRYRAVFDSTGDAICIVGIDGKFLEINREFCKKLGYNRQELMAMGLQGLYAAKESKPGLSCFKNFKIDYQEQFETEFITHLGPIIPIEATSKMIYFDNQPALILVARDISQRKEQETEKDRLQNQLQRAQKMEAIGMMAGGVAHDLNNILAGVVGYPQLLLKKLPEDSKMKPSLLAIQDAGERAANVVADLLTVARGVASTKETCNLNDLVASYLNSLEGQKLQELHPEITWTLNLEQDLAEAKGSLMHINKCLMNLATNAAEVISGQGEITIATKNCRVTTTPTKQSDILSGEYAVISVSDTGHGISKEDINHIFEPFYSKKIMGRSGTGLGLAVVWNTMQDHNGKVLVESTQHGTTFSLYFPVSRFTSKAKADPEIENNKLSSSGEKILIVDDEELLRDLATQMLSGLGYNAVAVESGEKAIELLRDETVQLIVLDMFMEPGINGRETYEKIVKMLPGQKAIITSGYSGSEDIAATMKLGAGGFLKKPYSLPQLSQAVWKELNDSDKQATS